MQFPDWLKDRIPAVGGASGSLYAHLLNIDATHLGEIALFALVGSLIGEGVKLAFDRLKKRKDGK